MLSVRRITRGFSERYAGLSSVARPPLSITCVKSLAHRIAGSQPPANSRSRTGSKRSRWRHSRTSRRDFRSYIGDGRGVAPEAQSQIPAAMKRGFQTRDAEIALPGVGRTAAYRSNT